MGKSIAGIVAVAAALAVGMSSSALAATPDPLRADVCVGENSGGFPCVVHASTTELLGNGVGTICAGVPHTDLVNVNPEPPIIVPGVINLPFGAFVSVC